MPDPAAHERFVERMGSALTEAGLPRLSARVFAALLVDDDGRMTAAELGEALGVSPAGVSGAVKYLDQIGMLRRERERGSRRDVYVVEDDAWHTSVLRLSQTYAPLMSALGGAIGSLDKDSGVRRRLVLSREFLSFFLTELEAIGDRWSAHRAEVERHLEPS